MLRRSPARNNGSDSTTSNVANLTTKQQQEQTSRGVRKNLCFLCLLAFAMVATNVLADPTSWSSREATIRGSVGSMTSALPSYDALSAAASELANTLSSAMENVTKADVQDANEDLAGVPANFSQQNPARATPSQEDEAPTEKFQPEEARVVETQEADTRTVENQTDRAVQEAIPSEVPAAAADNTSVVPWPGNLDHIADENNCIVVVTVTCPYIEMLDNLLESMRRVGVRNVAMVPLDVAAHGVLKSMYENTDDDHKLGVVVEVPSFLSLMNNTDTSKPASFKQDAFKEIVSCRPKVIKAFLERGYTVFYADTDTYWRSDPLPFLHGSAHESHAGVVKNGTVETFNFELPTSSSIGASADVAAVAGNASSFAFDLVSMFDTRRGDNVCTGYLYVLPTDRSIHFMVRWAHAITAGELQRNQPAFADVYKKVILNSTALKKQISSNAFAVGVADSIDNLRSRVYMPNNPYFPSGMAYGYMNGEMRNSVLMVHGNFIVGMGNKKARMKHWGVWKPSGRHAAYLGQCTVKPTTEST